MKIHFYFSTTNDICHIKPTKTTNQIRIPYATRKTFALVFCDSRQEEKSEGTK